MIARECIPKLGKKLCLPFSAPRRCRNGTRRVGEWLNFKHARLPIAPCTVPAAMHLVIHTEDNAYSDGLFAAWEITYTAPSRGRVTPGRAGWAGVAQIELYDRARRIGNDASVQKFLVRSLFLIDDKGESTGPEAGARCGAVSARAQHSTAAAARPRSPERVGRQSVLQVIALEGEHPSSQALLLPFPALCRTARLGTPSPTRPNLECRSPPAVDQNLLQTPDGHF